MKLFPKLRGEIEAHEMSHFEFAKMIGLGKTALSERLTGRKDWHLCEMYAAMDVLGLPYSAMHEYFPPIKQYKRRT